MDEIKIDDYGTPPLRGMLLKAVKARIKNMYFNTAAIGTFRQIIQAVHLPADFVEQVIKTNQRQSCLKPRHVEVAKELRMEGLSVEKIAAFLSEIEGFEITRNHLNDLEEFHHWKLKQQLIAAQVELDYVLDDQYSALNHRILYNVDRGSHRGTNEEDYP